MKLKNILVATSLVLLAAGAIANSEIEKQTVYSVVKQKQHPDWYREQANLWMNEIDKNSKSPEAWLNYYTAKRMLKILGQGVTQEDLNGIVKRLSTEIPNSFEYHYIAYWNRGLKTTKEQQIHLKKAHELGPNRVELMDDLFSHYLIENDRKNKLEVAKRWFNTNDISAGLYAWNYNMLQSVDANGILFTNGDNDTYPAFVLQLAKGVRNDVIVMNTSLLTVKKYCDNLLKSSGLPVFEKEVDDFDSRLDFQKAIVEHIKKHSKRSIYFAVTVYPELYASFKDELYNVGLAFKWSIAKFDNVAVIKRNFEKKYLLDYLEIDLMNDLSSGVVDQANANYLISMLTLYNHYEQSEDEEGKDMEYLIDRIAKKNGLQAEVQQVLEKNKRESSSKMSIDPRDIESEFIQLSERLHAGITEISNAQYELFLTDMLKQKRFDDLIIAKSEKVDWRNLKPEYKDYKNEVLFPNGHPDDAKAPVQNITFEAAQMYCQWLTTIYNSTTHKKKSFDNVVFRLPTEAEWELMARGTLETNAYPWNGKYCRNSKGCYLGNWDVSDLAEKYDLPTDCESCGRQDEDGGFFTVPVKSYLPNSVGLYNISGNIAEMISEKGKTKGGSWNTKAGVALIVHSESFENTSPEVGFRVVMEIK